MNQPEIYMHRCLELAQLGAGNVAPNPMVGAVLVHDDRIIGEGYHKEFGGPHAERNCIANVADEDKKLIQHSTLYVSLEPCAHFGKTPPCSDFILEHSIKKVVVGCTDPFNKVAGKGIEKLKYAGVEVVPDILRNECIELNKRFFTFHLKQRPFIILKWAQSSNQKIGLAGTTRVLISNHFSNRLVHKWRGEEAAIVIGTNTALADDPTLNVRYWHGKNPTRIILDLNNRLPGSLKIFDKEQPTIIINLEKNSSENNLAYYKIDGQNIATEIVEACYQLNLQSIIVEGGAQLLQSFIDANLWDEARVIQNNELIIDNGVGAPQLTNQQFVSSDSLFSDSIFYYKNSAHNTLTGE